MAFTLLSAVILGGIVILIAARHPQKVYVATADLPAFHRVTERDIRLQEMPAEDLPQEPMNNPDSLVGRYTLAPLTKDKPFAESSLGPLLARTDLDGMLFTSIKATSETTLGGRLARGDHVNVLLSTTAPDTTSAQLTNVLVVDVTREVVVVAITADESKTMLNALGTSHVSVARLRAYVRP
ncbi:SAF domain-containing protein [Planotetraspora mira]|uniref:SAF domain-containing protein n=1 Tax=Planotetraspora mira TaxID=58121 RepID=A0A8J3TNK7_9ACTN|nr:SAF domain-containing protein [Planotetraspora mira]GII29131.1 hypothetical protein Pmi06nite_25730 [Planotetraspora mira]